MNNFVGILLNGNTVLEFWLKSWFFQSLCLPEKKSDYPVSMKLLLEDLTYLVGESINP